MASENDRDDQFPRDAEDDVDTSFVTEALSGLDFLRADSAPSESAHADSAPSDSMPDWAWARITTALAAEQAGSSTRRPSRLVRWGGGLVAASVAVVAVGVGVTAFQDSGSGGAVVAGSATSGASATAGSVPSAAASGAEAADAATAFEAAEPVTSESLTKELAASRELSFASMVPPVFRLIDSQTSYTAAGLKDQVEDVMASTGMPASSTAVEEALAAPVEPVVMTDVPADGFTRSAESLRDCVTKLTKEEGATALLVDRSTFEGAAAGVIVAPEVPAASVAPAEDPAVDELEVMVVDPDCNLIMKVWIGLTR